MLCGVVGRVGDDSVHKSGFSVNGSSYIVCSFMYGNVLIVYFIVSFSFCCEV